MHLRWLAKIELRGTSPQVLNIIVNYCGTRVLLYAKMLKETEIEKTTRFFVMFLSLVAFQLRGRPPPSPWIRLWVHLGQVNLSYTEIQKIILTSFSTARSTSLSRLTLYVSAIPKPRSSDKAKALTIHDVIVSGAVTFIT